MVEHEKARQTLANRLREWNRADGPADPANGAKAAAEPEQQDDPTLAQFARLEALLAEIAHPKTTRSTMSPKEKSEHIRAHGLASYERIPWK